MKNNPGKILFSIDLEEFDIPEEYGQSLPLQTKLEVSLAGMQRLDALMRQYKVTGTLFTTAFWAEHHPAYIRELAQTHEIASHTYYHDRFQPGDLATSREALAALTGKPITGIRMPQMKDIDAEAIKAAGYSYDSSLHPTWLPGRYNHMDRDRKPHQQQSLWILPASVTPVLRIPVFWLALKNLPFRFYRSLCKKILSKDGYIVLYVHPWEFTDLSTYDLPAMVKRKDGRRLLERLEQLFRYFSEEGYTFCTHDAFIKEWAAAKG